MNWTEIWGWINEQWVALTTTGLLGLVGIKTFIFDKLNFAKKKEDYSKFETKVVALNQTTDVKVELIYEKLELTTSKLNSVLEQNKSLIDQNEQMKNLVVQTLGTANVPLASKEKFAMGLTEIFQPNTNVFESFKSTLDIQRLAQEAKTKASDAVIKKLSEV